MGRVYERVMSDPNLSELVTDPQQWALLVRWNVNPHDPSFQSLPGFVEKARAFQFLLFDTH